MRSWYLVLMASFFCFIVGRSQVTLGQDGNTSTRRSSFDPADKEENSLEWKLEKLWLDDLELVERISLEAKEEAKALAISELDIKNVSKRANRRLGEIVSQLATKIPPTARVRSKIIELMGRSLAVCEGLCHSLSAGLRIQLGKSLSQEPLSGADAKQMVALITVMRYSAENGTKRLPPPVAPIFFIKYLAEHESMREDQKRLALTDLPPLKMPKS